MPAKKFPSVMDYLLAGRGSKAFNDISEKQKLNAKSNFQANNTLEVKSPRKSLPITIIGKQESDGRK